MNCNHLIKLLTISALAIFCSVDRAAAQDNFSLTGKATFWNIQNSLATGEPTYYVGNGTSSLTGFTVQTGSIQPTSPLTPDGNGNLIFSGVAGPNLFFGKKPVHVIHAKGGLIFCTYTATFTIAPLSQTTATFSGVGDFTVVGGNGRWRGASGQFTTLFSTAEISLAADTATADVVQFGGIDR